MNSIVRTGRYAGKLRVEYVRNGKTIVYYRSRRSTLRSQGRSDSMWNEFQRDLSDIIRQRESSGGKIKLSFVELRSKLWLGVKNKLKTSYDSDRAKFRERLDVLVSRYDYGLRNILKDKSRIELEYTTWEWWGLDYLIDELYGLTSGRSEPVLRREDVLYFQGAILGMSDLVDLSQHTSGYQSRIRNILSNVDVHIPATLKKSGIDRELESFDVDAEINEEDLTGFGEIGSSDIQLELVKCEVINELDDEGNELSHLEVVYRISYDLVELANEGKLVDVEGLSIDRADEYYGVDIEQSSVKVQLKDAGEYEREQTEKKQVGAREQKISALKSVLEQEINELKIMLQEGIIDTKEYFLQKRIVLNDFTSSIERLQ
jgi:hypothetical protein